MLLVFACCTLLFHLVNSGESHNQSNSQIVHLQLDALKESLVSMKVFQFQKLFDENLVNMDTIFHPNFLFPNNVFASMGDSEFKNSLKMFTIFEPTATKTSIQALITISYRMGGKEQKMEKEVEISKNNQSSTGYLFTRFRSN
ncbi:unnamed protein product [Caenorhabditis nigoni]